MMLGIKMIKKKTTKWNNIRPQKIDICIGF